MPILIASPREASETATAGQAKTMRWHASLMRLYEVLTRNDPPQPVDLIFVMAGRMDRKPYGLAMYRAGMAPRLVLSVGRFEVSKMDQLDLEGMEELRELRARTPPDERHFWVKLDSAGARIEKAGLPRWSTYGEALGLRQLLEEETAPRVMVISTDIHLRRVAITFAKVFREARVEFVYCAVQADQSRLRKDGWWHRSDDRWYVLKEMAKLAGYLVILGTPAWVTKRLMRLKD